MLHAPPIPCFLTAIPAAFRTFCMDGTNSASRSVIDAVPLCDCVYGGSNRLGGDVWGIERCWRVRRRMMMVMSPLREILWTLCKRFKAKVKCESVSLPVTNVRNRHVWRPTSIWNALRDALRRKRIKMSCKFCLLCTGCKAGQEERSYPQFCASLQYCMLYL